MIESGTPPPPASLPPMTFEGVMEFSAAWGDRHPGLRNGKLLRALSETFSNPPREYYVMRQRAMRVPELRERYAEHVAHLEALVLDRNALRAERRFAPARHTAA